MKDRRTLILYLAPPCCVLLLALGARAQDCMRCHEGMEGVSRKQVFDALRHAEDIGDNAIGVQDRGELGNYSTNFGDMADYHVWHYEALHWPADASDVTQYAFGLGLVVATPGNVIESCLNATTGIRDWSPAEGSLGLYHTGEPTASDETPYMAHSNIFETWPGETWPGPWREEYQFVPVPGSPVVQVLGEFTSDSDTWCVFDDRENPLGAKGIEVRQSGYSYGRPYADDHLFWRSVVYNRSDEPLDSVYVGYYTVFRPDYDFVDRIGRTSTEELELPYGKPADIIYVMDANNASDGAWAENLSPMGVPALMVIETPQDMGITDFHHFQGDFKPSTDEDQWAVISSQPGLLESPELYFHSQDMGRIDDCTDEINDLDYGGGSRINFFVMTGPISLAPGDSVISSCAALIGEAGEVPDEPSLEDLLDNVADAWDMYWRTRFSGPGAPPMPEVGGSALPGGALVWWESEPSENAEDFEGYRVYRSEDRGRTWGDPITDEDGRRVGWVPLAQYDLADDLTGLDPNGYRYLGSDSGLEYEFEDIGRVEGLEYWYCVTAYSTGEENPAEDIHLPSIENPLGRSLLDRHTIDLIPGAVAADQSPSMDELTVLEPLGGLDCDGYVAVRVLDPQALPETDWLLRMHSMIAPDSFARFDLIDLGAEDTLYIDEPVPAAGAAPLPALSGFRLLLRDAEEGVSQIGWNEDSPCTFDWWMEHRTGADNEYPEYVVGHDDFRVRVTEASETIEIPSFIYWFSGGDTLADPVLNEVPLRAEMRRADTEDWIDVSGHLWSEDLRLYFENTEEFSELGWDLVPGGLAGSRLRTGYETYTDALILRESDDLSGGSEILIKTNNFDWIWDAEGDTLWGVPPEPGDVFTVISNKTFRDGVSYEFHTAPPAPMEAPQALNVRTVPDPYIAGSELEAGTGGHRLMFTHLPADCTIRIFTLAGDLVHTLYHEDPTSDTYTWDLRNSSRQHVAYGLYVFHVRDGAGREQVGRFLVIR